MYKNHSFISKNAEKSKFPTNENKMIMLTQRILNQGRSDKGNFNKEQLITFGITERSKRWEYKILGHYYPEEDIKRFICLKNAHIKKSYNIPIKITGITVFFDGSITFNPGGRAACSFIIKQDNITIHQKTIQIGEGADMSCNVAEYAGLYHAMYYLIENNFHIHNKNITFYGDSQLVIDTMEDYDKPFSNGLCLDVSLTCKKMVTQFNSPNFVWIPRHQNTECDAISR